MGDINVYINFIGSGGGARFEVTKPLTYQQLVEAGAVQPDAAVYEAGSNKAICGEMLLVPGKVYGSTNQAEYGN
jgi:hypothetical protein